MLAFQERMSATSNIQIYTGVYLIQIVLCCKLSIKEYPVASTIEDDSAGVAITHDDIHLV